MKTGFQNVALKDIVPSKTNPRKTFDEAALKDLADSITKRGVLQPILLRPAAKGFEIVAGERRFRAAKLAGLAEMPANVKELDDQAALEVQVIENLQRADLEPMEEAQGYKMLVEKHGYTVLDLAAKVQKSTSYIHHRMGLLKLHPEVQKAVAEGALGLGLAEILGRIDDPNMQREIFQREQFESVGELKKIVEEKYMLDLKKAPWKLDDEQLLAKAGPCSTCPKRSSAQGDLFGATKKDFCLDSACWKSKSVAHGKALAARYKAEGKNVLEGKKALELIKNSASYESEYAQLDSSPGWFYGNGSLREALKGKEIETVLAISEEGKPVELVPSAQAKAIIQKEARSSETTRKRKPTPGELASAEKGNAEKRAYAGAVKEMAAAIASKVGGMELKGAVLKVFAKCVINKAWHDSVKAAVARLGIEAETMDYGGKDFTGALFKEINKGSDSRILEVIAQVMVGAASHYDFEAEEREGKEPEWHTFSPQETLAKLAKVNVEAIQKRFLDEEMGALKEKQAKRKAKQKPGGKASKPTKKPKADKKAAATYNVNGRDVELDESEDDTDEGEE